MLLSSDLLREIVAKDQFFSVFQPIVTLSDGNTVGYEALTRFTEGYSPDKVFRSRGKDSALDCLELATLRKALSSLPELLRDQQFLAVNVSPQTLLAQNGELTKVFGPDQAHLVVEVTEYTKITDYASIRQATSKLGPHIRIALDDVGSEYSSLRKIVELHPDYLKLDIGLIQGLDRDPYRSALIYSLQHFAEAVGCTLIAEGVETEGERQALQSLGVSLGQGFLLGRPRPISQIS